MKSNKFNFYHVGGSIRDEILGLTSKDFDYSVEPICSSVKSLSPSEAYDEMNRELESLGFTIYVTTPDCFTTRAKSPKGSGLHQDADFVMCRKETYKEGSRQPIVEVGTVMDDLARRDFTINAIARCVETGKILDPFGGAEDLQNGILRCPVDPQTSFNDDPLRIIRAYRFRITKRGVVNLRFDSSVVKAIAEFDSKRYHSVSVERTMIELEKMFKHNTLATLNDLHGMLMINRDLYQTIMAGFWLLPTNKKK